MSAATNDGAPTALADLLKRATAEDHADAESHAFQRALVRGAVSPGALAAHQSGMLELVRLLGEQLPSRGVGWEALRGAMTAHASRLEQDLEGLGTAAAPPPRSQAVAALAARLGGEAWPPAAALGAFYVVEGSMNGNRFIRRALAAARPDLAGNLRYFDPYGAAQRERWRKFRGQIDRLGESLGGGSARRQEAVRAARATFAAVVGLAAEAEGRRRGAA